VLAWAHAILHLIKSQTGDNKIATTLALRYKILGFGTIVKLLVRALEIVAQSEVLLTATHFPELIDFLF